MSVFVHVHLSCDRIEMKAFDNELRSNCKMKCLVVNCYRMSEEHSGKEKEKAVRD